MEAKSHWLTLLEQVWREQDEVRTTAARVESQSKARIAEIMLEATMNRDGLRAAYQRLLALEEQLRTTATTEGETLPMRKRA